jgi:hypothetical protein
MNHVFYCKVEYLIILNDDQLIILHWIKKSEYYQLTKNQSFLIDKFARQSYNAFVKRFHCMYNITKLSFKKFYKHKGEYTRNEYFYFKLL